MKQKLSVSIEKKTIRKVEEKVNEGTFRNKSHVIEFALNKFLEKENE